MTDRTDFIQFLVSVDVPVDVLVDVPVDVLVDVPVDVLVDVPVDEVPEVRFKNHHFKSNFDFNNRLLYTFYDRKAPFLNNVFLENNIVKYLLT